MNAYGSLILGLGLFFLGMQLVGEHLRRLSATSFRDLLRRTTHSVPLASATGLLFGALMQSATAVTFIIASMVRSGLVEARRVLPVIIWCNVGLTALAFLLSFPIHPLVALLVGVSGIGFGMLRQSGPRAVAGILLGVGLILFGLEAMGQGAGVWKDQAWFIDSLKEAGEAPWLAFLAGLAAAAILQSNTGATLLIISFAVKGILTVEVAAPLIYGTNVGAVFLRLFLSAGMQGDSLRLVRFEDGFVIFAGLLMLGLFYLELAGVPLVLAAGQSLASAPATQLALIFLCSNLLPALLFSPWRKAFWQGLVRWIPEPPQAEAGRPKYLDTASLSDPASALDLLHKELARLLGSLQLSAPAPGRPLDQPPADFLSLGSAIEDFAEKITGRSALSPLQTRRLHLLRSELALIRHLEEALRDTMGEWTDSAADDVRVLQALLVDAATAADSLDAERINQLYGQTAQVREAWKAARHRPMAQAESSTPQRLAEINFSEDLDLLAWLLHRLAKLLQRISIASGNPSKPFTEPLPPGTKAQSPPSEESRSRRRRCGVGG